MEIHSSIFVREFHGQTNLAGYSPWDHRESDTTEWLTHTHNTAHKTTLKHKYLMVISSWEIDGETVETVSDFIFLGSKITTDGDCSHEIKRRLFLGRKVITNLDSIFKSRDITLPTKVRLVKANGFSCGHAWVWELDCEGWAPKNWCFWTVVLEKTLESPLDCKEIQPVHAEGDQPWDFFGRTDAKAETPVLWPPHAKSWLIRKDWCWDGLGAGGEGDDRGWDGWITSLTRWTWVWVNSRNWWWTGRPGMQ